MIEPTDDELNRFIETTVFKQPPTERPLDWVERPELAPSILAQFYGCNVLKRGTSYRVGFMVNAYSGVRYAEADILARAVVLAAYRWKEMLS